MPNIKSIHRKNRCFISVEVKPGVIMNLPEVKIEDLLESGVHLDITLEDGIPK